jgi:hypothetical protein
MKQSSVEVWTSVFSEGMGELNNQFEDKIAHLVVNCKGYGNEGVFPAPKGVLCSFCGREKDERDSIISGHTVSICSECVASFNDIRPGAIGVWPNLAI